ncbi:CDP-glycerol glycerophosphotransferase family protein [Sanguibacter sp. A247]|uniref:CDP-glycerol glycerophosphotransferase family protein n=1 Tax=unclassified Sanguibacter TaxID=2645534 RepID=UPI003FD7412F
MDSADAVDDEPLAWGSHLAPRVRQFYTLGARSLLLSAVALLATVLAAVTAPAEARLALLVPLALAIVLQRRLIARVPRGGDGLLVLGEGTAVGTFVIPRLIVLGTLAPSARDDALRLATLGVLGMSLLAEPIVRTLLRRAVPYALGVPDSYGPIRNWPVLDPSVGWLAWLVAGSATIVSRVTGGDVVALLLAVAASAMLALIGLDAFRRTVARLQFEARVPALMDEVAPAMILHWESIPGTGYQVRMWLPYLDRVGVPYVIVLRDPLNINDVRGAATVPVIVRPSLEQLDELTTPSLRVALYVNTSTKNQHFVRYPDVTHVQLNHGDSDKVPSHNPAFRLYDRNYVAGQAAVDRFAAAGVAVQSNYFRIVGRPQVENVAPAPTSPRTPTTVLYAPTWRGFYTDSDYSSLRVGTEIVHELVSRGLRVVFRPHPFARNDARLARCCDEIVELLVADSARTGLDHVHGARAEDVSVVECFNMADVMASDVSSVLGDFLHSEKPYVLLATHDDLERFRTEVPLAAGGYVAAVNDPDRVRARLAAALDDALGADPTRDRRGALRQYYLGAMPREEYADRFVSVLRDELGLAES